VKIAKRELRKIIRQELDEVLAEISYAARAVGSGVQQRKGYPRLKRDREGTVDCDGETKPFTMIGVKSGVTLTDEIKDARYMLSAFLPPGTIITSGLRSPEDQMRYIEKEFDEQLRKEGIDRSDTGVDGAGNRNDAIGFMLSWLRDKGYIIAAPGDSAHHVGTAFDLGMVENENLLIDVERKLRRLSNDKDFPFEAVTIQLESHPRQRVIHVNIRSIRKDDDALCLAMKKYGVSDLLTGS